MKVLRTTEEGSGKVSVIIPTKNRPDSLALAVRSLLAQSEVPRSLIIVDQSPGEESCQRVDDEMTAARAECELLPCLKYIHDPAVAGAAAARNRGMDVADGDIWLFLDDDVVLEPDFIEQLLAVYRRHPEASGVSGIITNYSRPALAFRVWSALFLRGPFLDKRQRAYWYADRLRMGCPIRVSGFTGAAMSFRAEALNGMRFDEYLDRNLAGVSDGEDVDFCSRLGPDAVLLIAPRARLEHRHDPSGRLADHWLRRHARGNLFLYRKHWKRGLSNRIDHGWLWLGYSLVATFASCRRRELKPWRALLVGTREASRAFNARSSPGSRREDPVR